MTVYFLLILNRQGKTRLSRWFNNTYTFQDKLRFESEIHRLVSSRDLRKQSNFIEYQLKKLVYRRYAGLYFIACIDLDDSELNILESLHFLVELLDTYFNSVCELDLVFNFYKLYTIVDQLYLGGEFQEVLKEKILDRLAYLDKLE